MDIYITKILNYLIFKFVLSTITNDIMCRFLDARKLSSESSFLIFILIVYREILKLKKLNLFKYI